MKLIQDEGGGAVVYIDYFRWAVIINQISE